jgi:hypothetical protein
MNNPSAELISLLNINSANEETFKDKEADQDANGEKSSRLDEIAETLLGK